MASRSQPEKFVVRQIASYLQTYYPTAIYRFDLAADLKLSLGQSSRHKMLHPRRGYPDLWIAEPRKGYCGLYLEVKAEGARVWLMNGQLSSDSHIQEQAAYLRELRDRGYRAEFCIGFDAARALIDDYFSDPGSLETDCTLSVGSYLDLSQL